MRHEAARKSARLFRNSVRLSIFIKIAGLLAFQVATYFSLYDAKETDKYIHTISSFKVMMGLNAAFYFIGLGFDEITHQRANVLYTMFDEGVEAAKQVCYRPDAYTATSAVLLMCSYVLFSNFHQDAGKLGWLPGLLFQVAAFFVPFARNYFIAAERHDSLRHTQALPL